MMEDPELGEKLLAYAEGTAPTLTRGEVKRHLEECAACRGWLESYRLVAAAVADRRDAADEHPSADHLAQLASGTLADDGTEQEILENHAASCATCGEVVRLSREAIEEARQTAPRRAWSRSRRALLVPGRPRRWAIAAGLVGLLIPSALAVRHLRHGQDTLLLVGNQLSSGNHVMRARTSIEATGVTLESGASVILWAGESVALAEGFSVASDATLSIEIGDSSEHAGAGPGTS